MKSASNVPILGIIAFIAIFSLSTASCKNKKEAETNVIQTNEEKNISGNQIINREFLRSDFFTLNLYNEVNYNINKWGLTFFSDDTYEIRPMTAGDPPVIKGNYQIKDDKVLLKYIDMPDGELAEYKFDSILKEDWELKYVSINNSLYFSEGLTGKGIIFAREKSKPKDNEIRTIDGHDVIIVQKNEDGYRLTANAKGRIGPGVNFQHCVFKWSDEWGTKTTEYVEEGDKIYIIGHSRNIDTINGLTGYWYYCNIPSYFDRDVEIIEPKTVKDNNVWIFGPLIDLK
jgi:hypothetical protein